MTLTRTVLDPITYKEQLFVDAYIKTLGIGKAAIAAGYSKVSAATTGASMMKRPHVCLAISEAFKEKTALARIDASWVLKRLALLADFSIKNFIVVDDKSGRLYYDFAAATDDDWYCINEITVGAVRAQHKASVFDVGTTTDRLWVDKVKLKVVDRMRALELLGKHVDVQAFKDRAGIATEPVTAVTRRIVTDRQPALPEVNVPFVQVEGEIFDGPTTTTVQSHTPMDGPPSLSKPVS